MDTSLDEHIHFLADRAAGGSRDYAKLLREVLSKSSDKVISNLSDKHIRSFADLAAKGDDLYAAILYTLISKDPKIVSKLTGAQIRRIVDIAAEGGIYGAYQYFIFSALTSIDPGLVIPYLADRVARGSTSHLHLLKKIAFKSPDKVLPYLTDDHIKVFVARATRGSSSKLYRNLLEELALRDPHKVVPNLLDLHGVVKDLLSRSADLFRSAILPALSRTYSERRLSNSAAKFYISRIYEAVKKDKLPESEASRHLHELMRQIYLNTYKEEPPVPRNPPLPENYTHPLFEHSAASTGGDNRGGHIPFDLIGGLENLNLKIQTIYDVHNAIDKLKNHRQEVLQALVSDLPEEQKRKKEEDFNKLIDRILPRLEEVAKNVATHRPILRFSLKLTPKDAYSWVAARIRASNDCTVPNSPYHRFEEHTVPYYFSSNAANYEIIADHMDVHKKGVEKARLRIRHNRHVGNVYLAQLRLPLGGKVLYISGIQLATPYRGKENTWVGKALVHGLVDLARQNGFHEVWLQTRDLSNFEGLRKAALEAANAKAIGSVATRVRAVDYIDLPPDHYAAPHKVPVIRIPLHKSKE